MSAWIHEGVSTGDLRYFQKSTHLEEREHGELVEADALPPMLGVWRVPEPRERAPSIPPQVSPECPILLYDLGYVRLDAVLEQRVEVRPEVL